MSDGKRPSGEATRAILGQGAHLGLVRLAWLAGLAGLAGLASAASLAACARRASPSGGDASAEAEATAYARQVFGLRCAACHGARGAGETARTGVPMPDFRDAAWQARTTDEAIERIVVEGGAKVGRSPVMPPNPDLATQPEVVRALRAHIRKLGGG
ncbi:c-type cytochrome [bacterium]|nr:MAG: c-type cytochrome [bacterium]